MAATRIRLTASTSKAPSEATEAIMFETAKAFGSFAVDDLAAARKFYGQTLGLRMSEEDGPLMLYLADDQRILVYPKPDHTPASFTILNFPVDDIDQAVDELTAQDVPIQRYEGFDLDDKGIYCGEGAFDRLVHRPRRQRPVRNPGTLSREGTWRLA
jgi:catechol 2,3-dioxygenase-like lactoylglutathione lyase family enzyme